MGKDKFTNDRFGCKHRNIENLIAASMASTRIPMHLECVSHTCEVFDAGNLAVLKEIENTLALKKKFISLLPSLKSFLQRVFFQLLPVLSVSLLITMATNCHYMKSLTLNWRRMVEQKSLVYSKRGVFAC